MINITEPNQPKRKRGRPRKNEQLNQQSNEPYNVLNDYDAWQEIASISDFITQYGVSQISIDMSPKMLQNLLRNPYANVRTVRYASKAMTTKHGIVKEVLRAIQTLPTLNYHLAWSSYDNIKQINRYEEKVHNFLNNIDVKQFVRHGLYETCEMGTVVCVLRGKSDKNKYVQFLDIDDLRIDRMRNGKWIVEFDLSRIKEQPDVENEMNLIRVIESLPDEVTMEKYQAYLGNSKKKGSRFVELSNCEVISVDNPRNVPFGLPYTLGAWYSIMQKELIDRLERSQANTLIKKILIMVFKSIEGKPPKKEIVQSYFKSIEDVIRKKDSGYYSSDDELESVLVGTGLISAPEWLELKQLDVTADIFPKHLYDKIENDIYANLGVSQALISGAGGNFSSAQVNSSKFFRYIFALLEKFEKVINSYIQTLLPSNLSCRFYFERTTINDRKDYINQCKELYQNTGIISPWVEALTGVPFHYTLGQARYEREVLNIEKYLYPPLNPHTMSGSDLVDNKGGHPVQDEVTDAGAKTRDSGGNSAPSPSRGG